MIMNFRNADAQVTCVVRLSSSTILCSVGGEG